MNKNDKQIAIAIIKAQIASDNGKGNETSLVDLIPGGYKVAGYQDKNYYILKAINKISVSKQSMFRYTVYYNVDDQNGYPSVIVYFSFRLNGEKRQISFHAPLSNGSGCCFKQYVNKQRTMKWDKKSSWYTAVELAKAAF